MNEVVSVIRSLHTTADGQNRTLAEVLDDDPAAATPPDTLSTEEQLLFTALIEHYREAFGDGRLTLDVVRSGATQRRDSASGLFTLSGRTDLVLQPSDQTTDVSTIRRIHTRQPRRNWSDPGYALLLRLPMARAVNDPVLCVERLWSSPIPGTSEHIVTGAEIEAFRSELLAMVTEAPLSADRTEAGWWCGSGPVIQRCPAVQQRSFEDVVTAFAAPIAAGP